MKKALELTAILANLGIENVSQLHDMVHTAETEELCRVFSKVASGTGTATIDDMVTLSEGKLSRQMLTGNLENITYFSTNRLPIYQNFTLKTSTTKVVKYVIECDEQGTPLENSHVMSSSKRVTLYHIGRRTHQK